MKWLFAYVLVGTIVVSAVLPVQMARCSSFSDTPLREVLVWQASAIAIWPIMLLSVASMRGVKCTTSNL